MWTKSRRCRHKTGPRDSTGSGSYCRCDQGKTHLTMWKRSYLEIKSTDDASVTGTLPKLYIMQQGNRVLIGDKSIQNQRGVRKALSGQCENDIQLQEPTTSTMQA